MTARAYPGTPGEEHHMQPKPLMTIAAAVAISIAATATAGAATRPSPRLQSLPASVAANRAATWLAGSLDSQGAIVSSGTPNLSDTALAVLAFEATGTMGGRGLAHRALGYLESHVNAYVKVDGADGPGQLATLILGAHALGISATSFGGTNLVNRLLATLQHTGAHAGLFGVQSPTYDGAYREGLSLAALAAVGVTSASKVGGAISWLRAQQCAGGGWEAFRTSTATPCPPTSATSYSGPDTNSTALAIEGLVAQHATPARSPLGFLEHLQASDGGWGYYGGAIDPDSTALVIQALVALGVPVTSPTLVKGSKDAASALLYFQLKGGAFFYPGAPNVGNLLATCQAIPALAKRAFPL